MTAVRAYLTEKAALGELEWLRREPRSTHPEILRLVAEATVDDERRTVYDDDVERYVNAQVGDLPAHTRHGSDGRDPLVAQLGHEVYLARTIIRDKRSAAALEEFRAAGWLPVDEAKPVVGGRYMLRCGTLYSGYSVPLFGDARPVRLEANARGWRFVEKRKRTAYRVPDHALVKAGWE